MTANPPTHPTPYPEPTQADHDAMFASVIWFRDQREAGLLDRYAGMHVAVLGNEIIDADPEEHLLLRRLEGLGDSLPPNRVVVQYVPGPEDWFW